VQDLCIYILQDVQGIGNPKLGDNQKMNARQRMEAEHLLDWLAFHMICKGDMIMFCKLKKKD